ncbi:MAG TPA: ABC transporter permease [Phycisphaerae bacterium]|nr:ABC transporter permease [Phycisphaerae bacterium]
MLPLRYVIGNLRTHRIRSALTMLGVGLVVGVFCYLLCFADGLRRALARSGDERNLIVLAEPATAESNSEVRQDEFQRLKGLPQAAQDSQGRPLVSAEIVVQTDVTRRGDPSRTSASIAVRGVDLEIAGLVHSAVRLVDGRWFQAGANELVVGEAAARQFNEGAIGTTVACGDRSFTVVGVFAAAGGVHESEFWGHSSNVAAAYRRPFYSSATVRLRAADAATVAAAGERVAAAGIALRAIAEPEYFAGQTQNARVLEEMALVLVFVMGIGTIFAAMSTMYAAVAGRTQEIGVLRAIGFSGRSVLSGVLLESLLLAAGGGVVGCLGCAAVVLLDRGMKDLVGTVTFTSVAFSVQMSMSNVALSMMVTAVIGLVGGFWPARAAGRLSVVQALRTV